MALTVGQLAVELDARTNEFRSGLKDAERRLEDLVTKTDRNTRQMNRSFRRLARGINFLIGAFGAIGTAIAAIRIGRFVTEGIQAAAEFERIGIQLEVLTGSAEGARRVLDDINRLVVETPYGLDELARAASSVAVVFGENTDTVREFTGIAADLAAAFGRPVEQIGENLTRAFSSGLGAADAFREAGITAEIMRVTGATDVSKVSAEELADALREITAEGGKAFRAAAKQAETLTGAISNTGISIQNFQRSFGEAIEPQVVFLLNVVLIPLFQKLESLVRDNTGRIRQLAEEAIPAIVSAFRSVVGFIAALLRGLGHLNRGWKSLQVVGATVQAFIVALVIDFRNLGSVVYNSGQIIARIVAAIGLALVGRFDDARDQVKRIREDWNDMQRAFREGEKDIDAATGVVKDRFGEINAAGKTMDSLADSLESAGDSAVKFAKDIIAASDAAARLKTEAAKDGAPKEDKGDPEVFQRRTAQQVQAQGRLETVLRQTLREREGELTVLQKQVNAIDDQIRKVQELNLHKRDESQRAELLALLDEKRRKAIDDAARAEATLGDIQARNANMLGQLAQFDPQTAAELANELGHALAAATGDPARQVEIAREFSQTLAQHLEEILPPSLEESLAAGITGNFRALLQGEAVSFGDTIGGVLFDRAQDALDRAFEKSLDAFGTSLETLFERAGDVLSGAFEEGGLFGGLGEALGFSDKFGELLGNSALGVLGAGLQAFRQEEGAAQAAEVRSAVTSSERVRGIIAGPTQYAVAQVDRGISDALIPAERWLEKIEENTRRTARETAPSGGGSLQVGGSSAATQALANESATIT